ncbi:beta-lactamase family protein [Aquincola sp. S2]|uniref:Beta-lactamase family protein n=1 Tax=Pseudaquabacterium terrae TaxID=2732868 RepID=A0ABX2E947_9BURK|nr:serine hydrolase domain-containing protein [Aquabacterium terrae]NRF65465.1 beta-lactamase family protein [Aquabacterium terrae]
MSSPTHPTRAPIGSKRLWTGLAAAAALAVTLPAHASDLVGSDPIALTRTYHGSDGSVFSTRAIGNTVVGFSQDASGQRAFVFNGTRSGMTITGQVYGLPKGASTQQGPLNLTLSNGGSTLQRTSGENVGATTWIAKLPSSFAFPHGREAKFQSTMADDLDGAYQGSDGSRAYVRQYGATVVTMTERFADADATRPVYATVGIATRTGNGLVGSFFDLPHQTANLSAGQFIGQKSPAARDFLQTLSIPVPGYPPLRQVVYTADYAVDLDRFAQEIETRLTPFVVGFSYAIAQNGQVRRTGAGGARRAVTATNGLLGPLPFTDNTLSVMASTTKTVTLVAMLRALRDRGVSVDAAVGPYLPQPWARGPGMNTVTFRQLLSHGLTPTVGKGLHYPASCANSPYLCLRDAVAGGMVRDAGYHNIHYALMRYLLPYVLDPVGVTNLFLYEPSETARNEEMSKRFRKYMLDMLKEVGVDADFKYVYGDGENGAYRYQWGTPPTDEIYPWIADSEDDYLEAGPGGLKMTSKEYARFLSKLVNGALLTPADLAAAKAIGFGGEAPAMNGPDGVGPLYTKNGGAGGAATQLVVYPGTEVFISQNSTGNEAQTNNAAMLRAAWKASLIGQ